MSVIDAAIIKEIEALKSGGTSTGGGGSTIKFNNPLVMSQDGVTMSIDTNSSLYVNEAGQLSTRDTSSGGSSNLVMHKHPRSNYSRKGYDCIYFRGLTKNDIKQGMAFRLQKDNNKEYHDFIIVITLPPADDYPIEEEEIGNAETVDISKGYRYITYIFDENNTEGTYGIKINMDASNYVDCLSTFDDVGLMEVEEYTPNALAIILQYDYEWRLRELYRLLGYFETTVEALKQKAGL